MRFDKSVFWCRLLSIDLVSSEILRIVDLQTRVFLPLIANAYALLLQSQILSLRIGILTFIGIIKYKIKNNRNFNFSRQAVLLVSQIQLIAYKI